MDADAAIVEMQGLGIELDPVTEGAFRAQVERINSSEPAEVPAPSKSVVRRTTAQKATPKGTSGRKQKGA